VGLESSSCLSLIPVFRTSIRDSYTVPRVTTLKLTKSHLWSVDSNIVDYRGFYVFRKAGSVLSGILEFSDDAGNVLASLEKKPTCRDSLAVVTLGAATDPGETVASIHYRYLGRRSHATIFLHETEDDISMLIPGAEISVTGDFDNYHYQFYYGGCRIAQVLHTTEPEKFCLEVGAWVDIAFLTMCASAIDLLHVRAVFSPLDNVLRLLSCCQPDLHDLHDHHGQEEDEAQDLQLTS